jgi:NADH dehydrogenase (ubiquinone) 1 beta subcomplex subunit 5
MAICLRSIVGSGGFQLASIRVALESTRTCLPKNMLLGTARKSALTVIARDMSGARKFIIHPPRFVWRRFKKDAHFFICLGVIPLTLVTVYANLVVGPAELAEIPEGYYPKEWEYYQNPVSRFLIRYVQDHPQKGYEQVLQLMHEEADSIRIRRLHAKVEALQAERMDYQGYLFAKGPTTKYLEQHRESTQEMQEERISPFHQI